MYQKCHKSLLCLRRSVLLKCQKASMSVCAAKQLLQCCSQILPEEQSSAHWCSEGYSSSLRLSFYGRIPEMQSVNVKLP